MSQPQNPERPPVFGPKANNNPNNTSAPSAYGSGGNAYGSAGNAYGSQPQYGPQPQQEPPQYGSQPQQDYAQPEAAQSYTTQPPYGGQQYGQAGTTSASLPPQAYGYGSENYWQASEEDKTMGWLVHLLGIFTSFVGPLIIYLVKKDESPFVRHHAAQSLSFQISVAIAYVVAFVLSFAIIGYFLFPIIGVAALVIELLALLKAKDGQGYAMPLALPLVK